MPSEMEVWIEADSIEEANEIAKKALRELCPLVITESRPVNFFDEILKKLKG